MSEIMKNAYIKERNLLNYEKLLEMKEKYQTSIFTLSAAFYVIPVGSVSRIGQLEGLMASGDIEVKEKME